MPTSRPTYIAALPGGIVISCLLLGGCASEQALLAQTQPLQEQISRVEQSMAASNEASVRAADAKAARLVTQQDNLEKQLTQVQTGIAGLLERLTAEEIRSAQAEARSNAAQAAMATQIARLDKSLADVTDSLRQQSQLSAQLQSRQKTDSAAALALSTRLGDAERRADEIARITQAMHSEQAKQKDILAAKWAAATQTDDALGSRMQLAEAKLDTLSGLVQEALALAAKELFLANGKEAFTVMLTDDKVLYPQNDPNLDRRDTAKLDDLADKLNKLDQEYHLDIQGHTENNSTDDNNYSLGKARAEVVKRYLYERKGISINRMSTISYGANKPLNAALGANRRIFIRVLVLK